MYIYSKDNVLVKIKKIVANIHLISLICQLIRIWICAHAISISSPLPNAYLTVIDRPL